MFIKNPWKTDKNYNVVHLLFFVQVETALDKYMGFLYFVF